MRLKPVRIVGGGLAGLSLGIALRKTGVPVSVWEAGGYPRHRVCGEVLSGVGVSVLRRLGVAKNVYDAGTPAQTTGFFAPGLSSRILHLPQPALCVSRYVLDESLARRFVEVGGDLRIGSRQPVDLDVAAPGVVRATGRILQPSESGWRWFGFKAHAENVSLAADVEMHFREDGYVGLCGLNRTRVNVCGLFRRRTESSAASSSSWETVLQGPSGTVLHDRLARASWDESSVCGVAGLSLRPRRSLGSGCCVGDAVTMISPVTGNGMSMALQAGELAAKWLSAYSTGELTWADARDGLGRSLDTLFAGRLRWGWWLNQLLFSGRGRGALFWVLKSGWAWRAVFGSTR